MALRDWHFVLSGVAPAKGRAAEIVPIYGRKWAELRLSPEFACLAPEVQRHTLVHELIHCHLAAAQCYADAMLRKAARHAFDMNVEIGIDGLADAIAPLMPLPQQPDETASPGGVRELPAPDLFIRPPQMGQA